MNRIALVTYEGAGGLSQDDRLLLPPLERRKIRAEPAVWDDPDVRWNDFDVVILRSCWDYHRRPAEFVDWLDSREREKPVIWNPPDLIRWNLDKGYLFSLAESGIRVTPTVRLARGSRECLTDLLERRGWKEAVIKPTISASAYRTRRTSRDSAARDQADFENLLGGTGLMVQEFFPEIQSEGEWSFIFLGEDYSHAVLKKPPEGDFRVQEEIGGTVIGKKPPRSLVDQARRVIGSLTGPFLYARVDGVVRDGVLVIMEVELIEPSLFLGFDHRAPERFAGKIAGILDGSGIPTKFPEEGPP